MRVTWSKRAVADLRKITDYIGTDNPQAAARVASLIFDEVMALATLSFRGRVGNETDTRELVFHPTPYIAIYRVTGEQVRIIRIRHAAQNWPHR
jgi:toxin ParE1/3/4